MDQLHTANKVCGGCCAISLNTVDTESSVSPTSVELKLIMTHNQGIMSHTLRKLVFRFYHPFKNKPECATTGELQA